MNRYQAGRRQLIASIAGAGLSTIALPTAFAEQTKQTKQTKQTEPEDNGPLSLSIVPSRFTAAEVYPHNTYDVRGEIRLIPGSQCINVAIRNRSRDIVSIWDDLGPLGFFSLHLEVTAMGDNFFEKLVPWEKPVIVERPRGMVQLRFGMTGVSPIPAGETLVRNLPLAPTTPLTEPDDSIPPKPSPRPPLTGYSPPSLYWGFPLPSNVSSMKMQMRAVLTCEVDEPGQGVKVWTGRIVSPLSDYEVRQEAEFQPNDDEQSKASKASKGSKESKAHKK